MRVPYKEIAFYALVKWNGKTEEEAINMINTLSIDELEQNVWAKNSVNHAVASIATRLNLTTNIIETTVLIIGSTIAPIFVCL